MAETPNETVSGGEGGSDDDVSLDARAMPYGRRHQTIFVVLERTKSGQALLLTNDHDPAPLHLRIDALYPDMFKRTYLKRGPGEWRVEIRKADAWTEGRSMEAKRTPCCWTGVLEFGGCWRTRASVGRAIRFPPRAFFINLPI